jgi:hypothetical protein
MRAFLQVAEVRQYLVIERTRNIPFGGHAPATGVDGTALGDFIIAPNQD